jgi:hypothetical protein
VALLHELPARLCNLAALQCTLVVVCVMALPVCVSTRSCVHRVRMPSGMAAQSQCADAGQVLVFSPHVRFDFAATPAAPCKLRHSSMDRWLISFTLLDTLLEIRSLWAQSGKHAHSLRGGGFRHAMAPSCTRRSMRRNTTFNSKSPSLDCTQTCRCSQRRTSVNVLARAQICQSLCRLAVVQWH